LVFDKTHIDILFIGSITINIKTKKSSDTFQIRNEKSL